MLSLFLNVLLKVAVLFLMIFAGCICGKKNLVTEGGAKEITSVLFWIVTPSLMISSLQEMIGKVTMEHLLISGALSLFCMLISILISMLPFRKSPPERKKILRFAIAYSNCGFMGLPMAQAVLGEEGVAYASMAIAAFNLFAWTHGVTSMRRESGVDLRRALINPGTVGLAVGLGLFGFSLRLPEILLSPVAYFADLNTPLAMLVIGVYVSRVPFRELFADRDLYGLSAVRLLAVPAVCFLLLLPLHVDRAIFTTALILISAPTAANTVMLSAQFGGDTALASKTVAITTLLSALTMPLFPVLVGLFY